MNRLTSLFCLLLLIIPAAAGCGSGDSASSNPNGSNIAKLARLYSLVYNSSRGVPPADEQAFRTFVDGLPKEDFDGNLDKLFVSDRDGQPYVMYYGKDIKQGPYGMIVGHEATGVDGRYLLCYADGMVEEVGQDAIDALK